MSSASIYSDQTASQAAVYPHIRLHAGYGTDTEANRNRLYDTASASVKKTLDQLSAPFGSGHWVEHQLHQDHRLKLYTEYVQLSLAAGDQEPQYMSKERADWVQAHMSRDARKTLATYWPREDSGDPMLEDRIQWDRNKLLEEESERLSCPDQTMDSEYYAAFIQAMIAKSHPDFLWAPTHSGLSIEQETFVKNDWCTRYWLPEGKRYRYLSEASHRYAKIGESDNYRNAQNEMAEILRHDYHARPTEFRHPWGVTRTAYTVTGSHHSSPEHTGDSKPSSIPSGLPTSHHSNSE